MPINLVTSLASRLAGLAPAGVLLLGAALILALSPVLAPRRRHALGVASGALAVLSLFLAGGGAAPDVQVVRVLVEWLGRPALAVRVPPFEPFLWLLALWALAMALAGRGAADRLSARDQAGPFALAAAAYGVVLAGNYRTLACALLLFDAAAALFLLARHRPGQAVGRLLLGVLSSGLVIALTGGADPLTAGPPQPGALFGVVTWLRLGLYPLVESATPGGFPPPLRLGWAALNLAVGLHLISAGVASWLVWPAAATMLLHGGLAWLEPGRDKALAHAGYALAGGILTMAAAAGESRGVVAASLSTVAGLGALGLGVPRLGRPERRRPGRWWAYLPPLLATASWAGVPLTLGWAGRGALYQATWEAGAPGTLALVVVAEGAALAALYRYWQRSLRPDVPLSPQSGGSWEGGEGQARPTPAAIAPSPQSGGSWPGGPQPAPAALFPGSRPGLRDRDGPGWLRGVEGQVWPTLAATLAGIPLLIPVLRLPSAGVPAALANPPPLLSASAGLAGALLWAFFLGYGRRRLLGGPPNGPLHRGKWLLAGLPCSPHTLARALRLGWLLGGPKWPVGGLGHALDRLGHLVLRLRSVIEGEHYLAWAILLAMALVLVILLR